MDTVARWELAVTFLLPDVPVGADGLEHGFGGVVQPLPFLLIDMAKNRLASGGSAEMDVGGLPSHGVEQAKFGVRATQRSEFDAGTVWSEATNDPASAQLDKMIGTADGAVDDGLVENLGGALVILRPPCGRLDERFGFAGDASAVPVGEGDVAGMAETAESGNAVHQTIWDAGSGHEMLEGIDGADRGFGLQGGERVHFLPETNGIAEFTSGDETQPLMLFAKNEGAALFLHAFAVALEHGAADVFAFEGKASGLDGEVGADGQADQIDGVGHRPGFVEIIDAPDEAAFDVTPGAEVLDVEIADREDVRSFREVGTDLGPELRPAVVGGAEEGEKFRLHAGVF